jgi:sugar/nucleoside kinase (ribokinase family)
MKKFQVTVLTGAIVDILSHIDLSFSQKHNIEKKQHRLLTKKEANYLYSIVPPTTQQSGGTLSNTISSLGALGIKGACLAKVFDDEFGRVFLHDMKASNVHFPVKVGQDGDTAHSIILIYPDAERVMNTCLGGCYDIDIEDLDQESLTSTEYLCVEAYSWLDQKATEVLYYSVDLAKKAGVKIVFSLSAETCIKGNEKSLIKYIKNNADIVIGNSNEFCTLFNEREQKSIHQAKELCATAVVTLGKKGSIIFNDGVAYNIQAKKPTRIVDTTGAGDAYAAGFIYGLIQKLSIQEAGHCGSIFAAQSISQIGARPCGESLKRVLQKNNLHP